MRNLLIALGCLFLLSACNLRSLNPFFTEDMVVFDNDILGVWANETEGQEWKFSIEKDILAESTEPDSIGMLLELREGNQTFQFLAVQFEAEKSAYLNLFPIVEEDHENFWLSHFIPAHGLLKIELKKDKLLLHIPDFDVAKDLLESEDIGFSEVGLVEDHLLITDESENLVEFVKALGKKKKGFDKEIELTRK
jgi:hypothetical protein